MISMERKRIETGIRALQFTRAEEEITPFSGMKEHVLEACKLRQCGKAQEVPHTKRKARLRLARRVALAAACLLIGVCVYSILDPVPASTANGFFSRAKVWIGSVLHLDVTMDAPPPPPPESESQGIDLHPQSADVKTIEEVHAVYGWTVYEPAQMPDAMKLGNVNATISDGDLLDLSYRYEENEDNWIIFTVQPLPDDAGMNLPEDAVVHTSPVGDFYVWETASGGWYAVAITEESIVNIKGTLSRDDFLKMLDTLRPVS